MAFYIMHDTFISQKQQHSVLKSPKSYGLKNVSNDEKILNHFEPKLLVTNFDYERRQTNELVKNNKNEISSHAKETIMNTTSKGKSFAKKYQLKGDKANFLPLAANNQFGNPEKIHGSEAKSIEERAEKCEKEITLVNDLNSNKKKEDTSKDFIKCSAQEDIQGKKIAISKVEWSNPDHNNNIQIKQETEENLTKTTKTEFNEYNNVQSDIEKNMTECVDTDYITRNKGEKGERQQTHLKKTKNDKTEELKSDYEKKRKTEDEFEGKGVKAYEIITYEEYEVKTEVEKEYYEKGKVDTECGKADYEETGEVEQVNKDSGEEEKNYKETKVEEGECKLKDYSKIREATEYEETNRRVKREQAVEYEEREGVKKEYKEVVEVKAKYEESREVEAAYEETGILEIEYKEKEKEDKEYKETGELEEVTVELDIDYEDIGQVEETVVLDIGEKETEEVDTEYKERGELEKESEETEDVEEYKETGEVKIDYKGTEEAKIGYGGTVNIQAECSKSEEVDRNLTIYVNDICSTNENRESEEKLLHKTKKKHELISQRNVNQKVIEREYEIYKALIIPHKIQEINFEEEFVAKMKGIEEKEKKIDTGNDTNFIKNEITKNEKQDINDHTSLKLQGTHEISPSREEGLYWIFLAVSWLPVLLLVSLAFSCLQMLADLQSN